MKNHILIGVILFGISSCSSSQQPPSFKQFTLSSHSFSAEKNISPNDSFMTKRYVLTNKEGDTLYLIQKVPFEVRNGNVKIYEVGLTERFVNLKEGNCYNITFQKDVNHLLSNPEYVKHRKVGFWFKSNKNNVTKDEFFSNFILESIIPCDSK